MSSKLRIGYGQPTRTTTIPACAEAGCPLQSQSTSPHRSSSSRPRTPPSNSSAAPVLPPLRPIFLHGKNNTTHRFTPSGGTGQLIAALKADEIDLSIALTEALITGIAKQTASYKIVGTYVTSPLNWAVAVGKDSKYQTLADLKGEKIGISRIGRCVYLLLDGRKDVGGADERG